jgi:hypothetical protein
MIIETKYEIGDHHFYLDANQVKDDVFREINIKVKSCGDAPDLIEIEYKTSFGRYVNESSVFPTKESLLQSL